MTEREPDGVLTMRRDESGELVIAACAHCPFTITAPLELAPARIRDAHRELGRHIAEQHERRNPWIRCLELEPAAVMVGPEHWGREL